MKPQSYSVLITLNVGVRQQGKVNFDQLFLVKLKGDVSFWPSVSVNGCLYAMSRHGSDPYQTLQWRTVSKGSIYFKLWPQWISSTKSRVQNEVWSTNATFWRQIVVQGYSCQNKYLGGYRPKFEYINPCQISITSRWHPSSLCRLQL